MPTPKSPERHTQDVPPEALREATWRALERDLERERSWVGRLRALPTSARVAAVAGAALAPMLVLALKHPEALDVTHAAMALLLVAATAVLLAPLSRPRTGPARLWLATLAVLGPAAYALLCGHEGHAASTSALRCFGFGAAWALPVAALVQVTARTPATNLTELALLSGLCGVGASVLLDVHCASEHILHLLLGHASVGMAWATAAGWINRRARA